MSSFAHRQKLLKESKARAEQEKITSERLRRQEIDQVFQTSKALEAERSSLRETLAVDTTLSQLSSTINECYKLQKTFRDSFLYIIADTSFLLSDPLIYNTLLRDAPLVRVILPMAVLYELAYLSSFGGGDSKTEVNGAHNALKALKEQLSNPQGIAWVQTKEQVISFSGEIWEKSTNDDHILSCVRYFREAHSNSIVWVLADRHQELAQLVTEMHCLVAEDLSDIVEAYKQLAPTSKTQAHYDAPKRTRPVKAKPVKTIFDSDSESPPAKKQPVRSVHPPSSTAPAPAAPKLVQPSKKSGGKTTAAQPAEPKSALEKRKRNGLGAAEEDFSRGGHAIELSSDDRGKEDIGGEKKKPKKKKSKEVRSGKIIDPEVEPVAALNSLSMQLYREIPTFELRPVDDNPNVLDVRIRIPSNPPQTLNVGPFAGKGNKGAKIEACRMVHQMLTAKLEKVTKK